MNYVAQIKKLNLYDLGRVSSHVYVPFFLYSNLISDPIDFSVDGCSEYTSTSFTRTSSNT